MRLEGLAEQLPGGIGGLDVPAALTSGPAIELTDGQGAQVPLHVIGDSTGIDVDEKAVGDLLGLLTEFGMPAEQRIEHDSFLARIERVEGWVLLGSVPFPGSSAFHPASPVGSPVGGSGLSTLRLPRLRAIAAEPLLVDVLDEVRQRRLPELLAGLASFPGLLGLRPSSWPIWTCIELRR